MVRCWVCAAPYPLSCPSRGGVWLDNEEVDVGWGLLLQSVAAVSCLKDGRLGGGCCWVQGRVPGRNARGRLCVKTCGACRRRMRRRGAVGYRSDESMEGGPVAADPSAPLSAPTQANLACLSGRLAGVYCRSSCLVGRGG